MSNDIKPTPSTVTGGNVWTPTVSSINPQLPKWHKWAVIVVCSLMLIGSIVTFMAPEFVINLLNTITQPLTDWLLKLTSDGLLNVDSGVAKEILNTGGR